MRAITLAAMAAVSLSACAYDRPADRCDGPCAVYALDRPIAEPGALITLEGTLDRDTVVTFPGSATPVALESYGPHRSTVRVPDDATAGGLFTLTNTSYTEPIAFRTATFRPELQVFRNQYEQTDVGRFLGGSELFARTGGAAVVAGTRVYLIGGTMESGAPSQTVDSMLVNADDTLGDPTSAVALLVTPRTRHASLVIGPYVYAIGGATASGATDTVEGATRNENDQLGAFGTLPDVKLTVPREGLAAAVIGNYVYVVGGKNDGGDLASIERAPIDGNGLIGAFEPIAGVELKTARSGHTLAVVGTSLYVIGGSAIGTPLDSIERLELFPDGYIGEPTVVANLATARFNHSSVVVGDTLYVIGGTVMTGTTNSIERIAFADMMPVEAGTLHSRRTGAMLVTAGNHVYVLGGSEVQGTPLSTFERASLIGHTTPVGSAGVMLDNFTKLPATLTTQRMYPSTLVLGNTLYVIGGANNTGPLASIEKATIAQDGTIGSFGPASVNLNVARMAHASFVYNNDVYVVGGRTSANGWSGFTDSVERAHIGVDGALGPFEVLGFSLDTQRGYFHAAVIARQLFVFSGASVGDVTAPTYVDSVKSVPLDAGAGSIPPLSPHSTMAARAFFSLLVLPTSVSLFGGYAGTAYATAVTSQLFANGTIAVTWNLAGRYPSQREGTALVCLGDAVFAIGGTAGLTLQQTQRASIDPTDDEIGLFSAVGAALVTPRYGHAAITIGNRVYVLGGFDNTALLDSIEVTTIH